MAFVYALILTRSRLGLSCIIILLFVAELWPLIDVRTSFLLAILITNAWNLTNFCVCIDINKIMVGIGMHDFSQIMILD